MGCEVLYKYEGNICDVSTRSLDSTYDTNRRILDAQWAELLALAAATPPVEATSEVGTKYPYSKFLVDYIAQIRREMEDTYWMQAHIEDCQRALEEHPDWVADSL